MAPAGPRGWKTWEWGRMVGMREPGPSGALAQRGTVPVGASVHPCCGGAVLTQEARSAGLSSLGRVVWGPGPVGVAVTDKW